MVDLIEIPKKEVEIFVDDELVSHLEEMLKEAKEGKIHNYASVYLDEEGVDLSFWSMQEEESYKLGMAMTIALDEYRIEINPRWVTEDE